MKNSVERILRVDHAGERGAISIYRAQVKVCKIIRPSCVEPLAEMLGHEERHLETFAVILHKRGVRACHALLLWATGGWLLGTITALISERAIWVCTSAIESTVNAHLQHQVEYLRGHDEEVLEAVASIQRDELEHEQYAVKNQGSPTGAYRILWKVVAGSTSFAIWLSSHL